MPAPSDYTDLDFVSLRKRLLALASSAFPDVPWDASASLEVLLLELNAYVGDVLSYYLNNAGRESRWSTAQQRRSLLNLITLIGYKPPGARAATFAETFTLASVASFNVTIPAGTIARTVDVTNQVTTSIKFQLLADLLIPAGQLSAVGTVEHSAAASDAFLSTGLSDQTYTLSSTPYLDSSAVVSAANGAYSEVANFLLSTATDRHYTVQVDDLDRATLRFGDGTNGAVPSGTIAVAYKTGGGVAGNVSAGKINKIDGNFTDSASNPVRLTVTNAAAAITQGTDRTSVAQIRVLAPESLRVLGRAVAREDFEIAAREVPGVARALHLTKNEDASIAENSGILFIVPTGGGVAGAGLLASVLAQFTGTSPPYPMLNTFQLAAQTAAYLTVGVACRVYVRRGYGAASVAASIRARLATFFGVTITPSDLWSLAPDVADRLGLPKSDSTSVMANPLVDFGFGITDVDGSPTGYYPWSDVFNLVRDTPGVREVAPDEAGLTLNGARQDVTISNYQFPVLGTVGIVNAADGSVL